MIFHFFSSQKKNTVPKQPPDEVFITVKEKQRAFIVKWSKVDAKVDGYRVKLRNYTLIKLLRFIKFDSN